MDPLDAAREALPRWVSVGPILFYPALVFVLTLAATMLTAAVAVWAVRRAPAAGWAERARVAWPIRIGTTLHLIVMPVVGGAASLLFTGPVSRVDTFWLGIAGAVAGLLAALPARRWVDARLGLPGRGFGRWLRGLAAFFIAYQPLLPLLALGAIAAGTALDARAWIAFAATAAGTAVFATGRGLLLAQALGLARPARARLREIGERVAARIGAKVAGFHELDWHVPNALAYPWTNRVAFTTRALEVLDDAEIEAVMAHEVGHL